MLWGGVVGTMRGGAEPASPGVEASLSSTKQNSFIGGALRIGDKILSVKSLWNVSFIRYAVLACGHVQPIDGCARPGPEDR